MGAAVVVATDHESIAEAVADLPVTSVLTTGPCASGTERVWRVSRRPEYTRADVILNVQGDEPLVERAALMGAMEQVRNGADVGTAAGPLSPVAARSPNRVKVSVDGRGRALRFFRTASAAGCSRPETVLHHVGVYAYRPVALKRWVELPPVAEERTEGLEQVRPLSYGMVVGVAPLEGPPASGVDTAGDLEEMEHLLAATGPGMDG